MLCLMVADHQEDSDTDQNTTGNVIGEQAFIQKYNRQDSAENRN